MPRGGRESNGVLWSTGRNSYINPFFVLVAVSLSCNGQNENVIKNRSERQNNCENLLCAFAGNTTEVSGRQSFVDARASVQAQTTVLVEARDTSKYQKGIVFSLFKA